MKEDTWIQEQLLLETGSRARMVTVTELRARGRGDLEVAVTRTGGFRFWAKKLGLDGRQTWTDQRIEKKLREYISRLGRMPSASELRVRGDNPLACAISRSGRSFYEWAGFLGVPIKGSETKQGFVQETRIQQKLAGLGHSSELTSVKESFDLLVEGRIRVEVKMATKYRGYYIFNFGKKASLRGFDLAILECFESAGELAKTYLIPAEHCRTQTVTITGSHRWVPWLERWELIEDLLARS